MTLCLQKSIHNEILRDTYIFKNELDLQNVKISLGYDKWKNYIMQAKLYDYL